MDARAFEGKWELLPERSRYENGEAPYSATYGMAVIEGGVQFTLEWLDSEGPHRRKFELRWDLDEPGSLELVDAHTLNTTVEQGEVIVGHVTRTLSDDGQQLTLVQRGFRRDATAFVNQTFYRRG